MTCQAFKPALNSMEVDAVGWDSDGLGYDTPGDDVDGDEHAEGAALEDLGPLRDKPAAAAAARARGQYVRAAALRKAIALVSATYSKAFTAACGIHSSWFSPATGVPCASVNSAPHWG